MLVAALVVLSSLFFSGVSSADGVCEIGCRNLVIPSQQCLTAVTVLTRMFQGISLTLNPDTVDCNRDTAAFSLEQLCTRECLSTYSTFFTCTNNIFGTPNGVNITEVSQTYCTRHADGTFCPLKILEESTGTSPVPLCTPGLLNICNSTCQESYRSLSSRLGCCGGTWFTNPSPLSGFERFFNSCNVTLEEQCEPASLPLSGSGAGVLYLSMLLVVTASLLSTIIV